MEKIVEQAAFTWPAAFAVVGGLFAFACMLNGFPNIKIGGKHEYHNHYDKKEDDE